MAKAKTKHVPFPTKEEVLEYIQENPSHVGKRELARAFRLPTEDRPRLRDLLKELERDGLIQRGKGKRYMPPGSLPEVTVLEITGIDSDGEVLARPLSWREKEVPPKIYMAPERRGRPALAPGDKVLARLRPLTDKVYEGRTIRQISAAPQRVLAMFTLVEGQPRLRATDRKHKSELVVAPADTLGAQPGDLVEAEMLPGRRFGMRQAKVVERLGRMGEPRSISLIAIRDHDIPVEFPHEAVEQAEAAGPAPLAQRRDLRDIPLVTIDGADARDFDDAVWAQPDDDPANDGGWHCIVAIADVSWYVRPGDALDVEAYKRGNSVYFPDRVVPMLPMALSNGWCSLNPEVERPCLAVDFWIDRDGQLLRHRFARGLMRSAARLTYEQVQAAHDGFPDDTTGPLLETVIAPLYGAFDAMQRARRKRGVLELELAERKIVLDDEGHMVDVVERERFDSHKLIEEFMITANVAAAETLEKHRMPCMYRVHDAPNPERIDNLREFLASMNLNLAKGQVIQPRQFNQIIDKVRDTANEHLVNEVILRSQAQAVYSPENLGHFGLALRRYAHFTSPIRRYADLLVHRALVASLKLGEGGLPADHGDFSEMGEHISATERRAQAAERDAVDRFAASFLADRVGAVFGGRITGATRFGLFVTLDGSGADGLVPISSLPDDYYDHDEVHHCLVGRRHRRIYRMGDRVEALLAEAEPLTGSLVLHLTEDGRPPANAKGAARTARSAARKGRPTRKIREQRRAQRRQGKV